MADRPWLDTAHPQLKAECALLRRLNGEQPPVGSVERGWAALSAEIATLEAAGAVGQAHVAAQHALSGSKWAAWAKLAAVAGVAGGAAWGGAQLLSTERTPPTPSVAPTSQPRVAHATPVEAPAPSEAPPAVEAPPSAEKPPSTAAPSPGSTLAEEGKLLAKARQLLRAGQAPQALQLLQASARRYPKSVLAPEREVLTIETLAASGAAPAAKARAQRFLERNPTSPYAERLQRFAE